MKLQFGAYLPGGPLRAWQVGAVFLPFLLPMFLSLRFWADQNGLAWLIGALGLPLLGLLVAIWIAGLVKGLPTWALPGLGVLFFFVSAAVQLASQAAVFLALLLPVFGGWPGPERMAANIGMMLVVQAVYLVVMLALAAGLLRLVPAFAARVRQEWTLLAFLLYAFAILPVLGNDEFHGQEGYELASLLVLAAGAGLYLLAARRGQRVAALVVPVVLSPVLMSVGLYQVFPAMPWADPADASFRVWEALQPVLYLAPLPVLLAMASWIGKRRLGTEAQVEI